MFKTESICSKEHLYGVSIFMDIVSKMFGSSWDKTKFGLVFLIAWFLHHPSVCCVFSPFYSSFTVAELYTSGHVWRLSQHGLSLLVFSYTYWSFTVAELYTSGLVLINHHVQCPSKVKRHTLAVYIKEQKMPQKSLQEPYLLECGGIRGYNARKSFNLT